ncbi:MAG: AtpZ/AtpI family protein [Pseudomonadota bacterium]
MADEQPGQKPDTHNDRLDSLDDRLDRLEKERSSRGRKNAVEADPNYRMGTRVLADLVAGVAGGLLFGWLLDRWLGTSPWLMLVFLFLGIIVAFRNIMRLTGTSSASLQGEDESDKG